MNRLSFLLAKKAVLAAVVLGMMMSIGQLAFDWRGEKNRTEITISQILNSVKHTAGRAVFHLDSDLAAETLDGLFEYRPIFRAEVFDDLGNLLAKRERAPMSGFFKGSATWLFDDLQILTIPLFDPNEHGRIGRLTIYVDPSFLADGFIERSLTVLVSGLLRNVMLALVLILIFHYTLTKPLLVFINEFRNVDPFDRQPKFLRVPAAHEQDELGVLVHSVNQHLSRQDELGKELRESEERFRTAFGSVTVGCIVIDEKGIINSFNSMAEEIFGHAATAATGQNVRFLMPAPFIGAHIGYVKDFKKDNSQKVIFSGGEVRGLRKNGEEFPMHLGVAEMTVGGKKAFIASVTDLTEIKFLEKKLLHAQRMEAVGQLTGGIAHDFNNLLAVMIGNAEMLEIRTTNDQQSGKNVNEIIKAVERASSLTDRLLTFSRRQTLAPVSTNISSLIGGLDDMLKRSLGATINLTVEAAPDLWPATIDPHQFENALVNLAINARDAMPDGGQLTIKAANTTLDENYARQHEDVAPGDYVQVAVMDTGAGMSADVLEKVFEPFFTTKDVGKGSGLGLSMVYGFVKQSSGHITVDSDANDGTTVKLYIPQSR